MKHVFFLEDLHYNHNICDCLRNEKDAQIPPGLQSHLSKRLFRLHNAWALNKKYELPFKKIWFHSCLDESRLSPDDEIVFSFFESYHMTYSGKFLRYLKRKYPNGKTVFAFTNPADAYNLSKLASVRKYYDMVSTFSREDAKKYGFSFSDINLCCPAKASLLNLPESDVFFVGADKGRLDTLISIYETLTAGGLRCDFHIVGVPEKKQKYADVIHYNKPISYDEVVSRLAKCKCALEVLQGNYAYNSRRTAEAYVYRKKLLTTNHRIVEERYYSPEIVQIVTDPQNIDLSFFEKEIDNSVYAKHDFCSFSALRQYNEQIYRQIANKKS